MAIYNEAFVTINLNELVECRAKVVNQELDKQEVHKVASELQQTLTWDTLYHMVDTHILTYKGNPPVKYGSIANESWLLEIERNKKCFKMVELKGGSWTIQVPQRIKG
tara:strand:- start:273 stop:596 length:324 start_codon:yes stop_codon:yes gene_type:complete